MEINVIREQVTQYRRGQLIGKDKYPFKQSQRLRVIVEGIHFYSTVKQVQAGVGDNTRVNSATSMALWQLSLARKDGANGLCGRWDNLNVQIDLI